jgi:hypothetical protein
MDYGLNSPFVYLRSLIRNLSTPGNGEGGSEHVPLGASVSQRPPTQEVERFLSFLRLDSTGKVNALGRYAEPKAIEMDIARFESLQVLITTGH